MYCSNMSDPPMAESSKASAAICICIIIPNNEQTHLLYLFGNVNPITINFVYYPEAKSNF